MKKSQKIWIIVISVVLVFVLGIVGVCIWFFSPGIHVIGPFAHLDAEKKCYYIDNDTGEILGESTLTVDCYISLWSKTFSGSISLPEYPVEGDIPPNLGEGMIERNGYIRVNYMGIRWSNQETGKVDPEVDLGYYLYVKDADHLFLMTDIANGGVFVVCADNEEEAREMARTAYKVYWGMEPQKW